MIVNQYSMELNEDRNVSLVKEAEIVYEAEAVLESKTAAELLELVFANSKKAEEHMYMIALDSGLVPKGIFDVSCGTSNAAHINVRGIFSRALLCGACNILLAHNHVSGRLNPSLDDISATKKIIQAGELMDIKVLDHLIVLGNNYISMREEGVL